MTMTVAMALMFIAVYAVTPYPFAWELGTLFGRFVLSPVLLLAAFVPLLLEHLASRFPGSGSADARTG